MNQAGKEILCHKLANGKFFSEFSADEDLRLPKGDYSLSIMMDCEFGMNREPYTARISVEFEVEGFIF